MLIYTPMPLTPLPSNSSNPSGPSAMEGGTRLRRFFKVLLGDFSQQLMIPPGFVKHMPTQVEEEEEFLLENSRGRTWSVETRRTANGVFLMGDGWSSFVEDNGLKEFEFLVFGYDGGSRFDVKVFGTSACEKHVGTTEGAEGEGKRKRTRLRPKRRFGGVPKRTPLRKDVKKVVKVEDMVIEEVSDDHDLKMKMVEDEKPLRKTSRTYRQTKRDCIGVQPFTSTLPHFTLIMRRGHVSRPFTLIVPVGFARAYMPKSKTSLVFQDPRGTTWDVTYTPATGGISGGWKRFLEGNGLLLGDSCTFELVAPLKLRVHILRGISNQLE